jgi:hypothetical protein
MHHKVNGRRFRAAQSGKAGKQERVIRGLEGSSLVEDPRKGDEFFKASGENWHTNAHLHVTPDTGYAYSRGYRIAAQAMAQRLFDGHGSEADFLVYPAAFLYRRHIELMLKRLIVTGSFLDHGGLAPLGKKRLKSHRLDLCGES